MLYNSFEFIFAFLPLTIIVFYQLGQRGYHKVALGWLLGASFFFYGRWNPVYLGLFVLSLGINYALAKLITPHSTIALFSRYRQRNALSEIEGVDTIAGQQRTKVQVKRQNENRIEYKWTITSRFLLIFGIILNLGLLAYFKYANFFVNSLNTLVGTQWTVEQIILPLGISFITFQQMAYLVDTYKGKTENNSFLDYALFISFFPQLIAGPIVRHKELIPQFKQPTFSRWNDENLAVGLTIFSIGLFKKVVFADSLIPYINLVYDAIGKGINLSFFEAWTGILALALRIYFDFSGYSDMAIGIARMFGIKLPLNFDSPYKAVNINQFWSRWHMTLTRFFRDYVYLPLSRWLKQFPLGQGNQALQRETVINTLMTLSLTGVWHGAGWNFLAWGALHGLFLVIYQQWRDFRRNLGYDFRDNPWWSRSIGCLLTLLAWVFALVLITTHTVSQTWEMWRSMLGFNGLSLSQLATYNRFLAPWGVNFSGFMPNLYTRPSEVFILLIGLLLIVWFTPNTQQWMGQYQPALDYYSLKVSPKWQAQLWQKLQWKPNKIYAIISFSLMTVSLLYLTYLNSQEFIYFQF